MNEILEALNFEQSFEGHTIEPVKKIGLMEVYRRKDWRQWHMPKYVVFHINGRALEEFRLRKSALKWAEKNKNG